MGEEPDSLPYDVCKEVTQDVVDDFLDTQDGKLVNTQSALCKHGSKGMCNNCVPLDVCWLFFKEKGLNFDSHMMRIILNKIRLSTNRFIHILEKYLRIIKIQYQGLF